MKKAASILLTLLSLLAIMQFYVANHYCGGKMVASRISFTGRLASCGMTTDSEYKNNSGTDFFLKSHCCEDHLKLISAGKDYKPSNNSVNYYVFPITLSFSAAEKSEINLRHSFIINSILSKPPGVFNADIHPEKICVLRI